MAANKKATRSVFHSCQRLEVYGTILSLTSHHNSSRKVFVVEIPLGRAYIGRWWRIIVRGIINDRAHEDNLYMLMGNCGGKRTSL
jgi:hypothetical protein